MKGILRFSAVAMALVTLRLPYGMARRWLGRGLRNLVPYLFFMMSVCGA